MKHATQTPLERKLRWEHRYSFYYALNTAHNSQQTFSFVLLWLSHFKQFLSIIINVTSRMFDLFVTKIHTTQNSVLFKHIAED